MTPVSQRLHGLNERDFTLNLKGSRGFHTRKLLASLVNEAGKTQPWIEGRELWRKVISRLCIWVALTATLDLNLRILYMMYVPTVSSYECFHTLEAFCISFSENRAHSLCLFFYWFVCFFSCIYRHYQGN